MGRWSILCGWSRSRPAQAVADQIDAMGVVDEAIEDGIGVGWVTDDLVPFVDRHLAGEDGRASAVAFFEDLVEIAAGAGVERVEAPIVEDEELDAGEAAHDAGVAAVAARQGKIGKELGDALRLAISELSPRAAEMFTLRYLEDLGNREIAALMGTSQAVVAVTLHNARTRLRKRLSEMGGKIDAKR